jgi:Sad1 / UNC-like C-terminal
MRHSFQNILLLACAGLFRAALSAVDQAPSEAEFHVTPDLELLSKTESPPPEAALHGNGHTGDDGLVPAPSAAPSPEGHILPDDVFVPLRAWKEQRIQDIQLRVERKKEEELRVKYHSTKVDDQRRYDDSQSCRGAGIYSRILGHVFDQPMCGLNDREDFGSSYPLPKPLLALEHEPFVASSRESKRSGLDISNNLIDDVPVELVPSGLDDNSMHTISISVTPPANPAVGSKIMTANSKATDDGSTRSVLTIATPCVDLECTREQEAFASDGRTNPRRVQQDSSSLSMNNPTISGTPLTEDIRESPHPDRDLNDEAVTPSESTLPVAQAMQGSSMFEAFEEPSTRPRDIKELASKQGQYARRSFSLAMNFPELKLYVPSQIVLMFGWLFSRGERLTRDQVLHSSHNVEDDFELGSDTSFHKRNASTAAHPSSHGPSPSNDDFAVDPSQWQLQVSDDKPYNFASNDAGARVLAASSTAVGSKNVLLSNPDMYMLVPCEGDGVGGSRWIDIELSEDAVLTSFETANFEFYSSFPSRVAVLGATSYPPKTWNVVAVFDMASVRTMQKFKIPGRAVARYLRIIFTGKQGSEYYCPISVVRVFGKTLLADWKDELDDSPTASYAVPKESNEPVPALKYQVPLDRLPYEAEEARSENVHGEHKAASLNTRDDIRRDPVDQGSYVQPLFESCVSSVDSNCHAERRRGHGTAQSTTTFDEPILKDHLPTGPLPSQLVSKSEQDRPDSAMQSREGLPSNGMHNTMGRSAFDGNTLSEPVGRVSGQAKVARGESSGDIEISPTGEGFMSTGTDGMSTGDVESTRLSPGSDHIPASSSPVDEISEEDISVLNAVRQEVLSPVSSEENIFRKVTRMIRVLELNQSLTNQYIDTHLAKYASALTAARADAVRAREDVALMHSELARLAFSTRASLDRMSTASMRRDILICILLVLVALLVGSQIVLWTALTGVHLSASGLDDKILRFSDSVDPVMSDQASVQTPTSVESKRRRRRGRDKRYPSGTLFPKLESLNAQSDLTPDRRAPRSVQIVGSRPHGAHHNHKEALVEGICEDTPDRHDSRVDVFASNPFAVLGSRISKRENNQNKNINMLPRSVSGL